jgi:hypothetical protein
MCALKYRGGASYVYDFHNLIARSLATCVRYVSKSKHTVFFAQLKRRRTPSQLSTMELHRRSQVTAAVYLIMHMDYRRRLLRMVWVEIRRTYIKSSDFQYCRSVVIGWSVVGVPRGRCWAIRERLAFCRAVSELATAEGSEWLRM